MHIINKQTFNNGRGYALVDFHESGEVVFFADLPDGAVVDTIKVGDSFLEDLAPAAPLYPRTLKDGVMREIAIVRNATGTKLHTAVQAALVEEFDVYYHDEAVHTVR